MKFSILIPAYKKQYLQECIESILAQTYSDFEIVIVNDASPEDLDSVVNGFTDPRIHYYVNKKNCGAVDVVDNWNICLEYSLGEYVICMGDDDRLLPKCLEEYNNLVERYPGLGIYHAWTEIINENSNVIRMQEARPVREGVYSMIWGRWNGRTQYIGDFLFESKRLKNNGGFYKLPLAWASDDISTYIAAKKTGIANMQIPGFQYRINSQTISKTGNAFIKLKAINEEENWYKNFFVSEQIFLNEVEKIYYKMLLCDLPKVIAKKKIYTLSQDMADNGLYLFVKYWKKRKYFCLNYKLILYAIIEAIKRKYVRSNKNI